MAIQRPFPLASRFVLDHADLAVAGSVRTCLRDELLLSVPKATALPVGVSAEILVSGGTLERPVGFRCEVRRRVEAGGERLYGVTHDVNELRGVGRTAAVEERRAWGRVSPDVQVPVVMQGGETTITGFLVDVSAGGLAVWTSRDHEVEMAAYQWVSVHFIPPGGASLVERRCEIRSRLCRKGKGMRYGLRFGAPQASVQFEALWDCGRCGQSGLLAESHRFCPDCGVEHSQEPSVLPGWENLIAVSEHRFSGNDKHCGGCGGQWHRSAAHCGHCGLSMIGGSR